MKHCLSCLIYNLLIYSSEFAPLILFLALNKEFKDKRKKHYNEYSKVKLARKLIEQELKDLEDDDDSVAKNTTEAPSSSQDADTQVHCNKKQLL